MPRERGQSAVVGVILLLAITVVSVGLIVSLGSVAIDDVREQVRDERAQSVSDEFAETVLRVVRGEADARTFDTGGTRLETGDGGTIEIYAQGGNRLIHESLGTATVGAGDERVVYQGGAVLDVAADGTAAVRSAPSIRFDTDPSVGNLALSVTLVYLTGSVAGEGTVRVEERESRELFPAGGAQRNPIPSDRFRIVVTSEYYEAWGAHFERTYDPAMVSYDHAANTVTVEEGVESLTAPVFAGTPNGDLTLTGGVSVDSYNSNETADPNESSSGRVVSAGDVTVQGGGTLTDGLRAGGDVVVRGGSTLSGDVDIDGNLTVTGGGAVGTGSVEGDVAVAGDVSFDWGASFEGNLTYNGSLTDRGGALDGQNVTKGPVSVDVGGTPAATGYIEDRMDAIRSASEGTTAIQNCDGTCELDAGDYYLDDLSIDDSEELILNTTDGDVNIAVAGDTDLRGSGGVTVEGDGRVNVYTTGDFEMRGGTSVTNDGRDAPQFWLYLQPDATADLNGGGEFVGAIYGAGEGGDGATIEPSVPVYGALVGDVRFVGGGTEIHYDAALADVRSVPQPPDSHLHVYEVGLNVTEA